MKNVPLVSVIIPMYNTEEYVAQCIESLLNQTFKNLEIIIIDDNSTDKSRVIVENYCSKYDNVFYRRHDINKGPMVARQEGVELSSGQYVFFVDSDDWLPHNAIELLYKRIQEDESDVVVGDMVRITNNNVIERRYCNILSYGNSASGIVKSLLREETQHVLCGKLFRIELLQHQYQIYENMTNSEDALMFYQMLDYIKKMTCVNEVIYYYRRTPNSSSNKIIFSDNQINNYFSFYKYLYLNVIPKYPECYADLDHFFFKYLAEMLKVGCKKKLIREIMLPVLDINSYFSLSDIYRRSKGLYKVYNVMLFSSSLFRLFSKRLYIITH